MYSMPQKCCASWKFESSKWRFFVNSKNPKLWSNLRLLRLRFLFPYKSLQRFSSCLRHLLQNLWSLGILFLGKNMSILLDSSRYNKSSQTIYSANSVLSFFFKAKMAEAWTVEDFHLCRYIFLEVLMYFCQVFHEDYS